MFTGMRMGENRFVPMEQALYEELTKISSKTLVFYSLNTNDGIVRISTITKELYRMLQKIGIDEEERKKRNLTFHGWRHFFNTLCRNSGIPDNKVQVLTGHSTQAMTDHYMPIIKNGNAHNFSESIEAQKGL